MEKQPTQTNPSAREQYYQRMRERMGNTAKNIDWQGDDEENRYGALLRFDDEQQKTLGNYKQSSQKLGDLFTRNPKFAAMLQEVMQGTDPSVSFVKYFGRDALDASGDEEKIQLITQANQEYLNRVATSEQLRKTQEQNLEKSGAEMETFQKEKNITDQDFASFIDAIYNTIEKAFQGILDREFLQIFWQGLSYENDIHDAATAGEIQARNQKIEMENRTRQPAGNLPDLHGKTASDMPASRQTKRSFYE